MDKEITTEEAKKVLQEEMQKKMQDFAEEYKKLCEKYKMEIGANLFIRPIM